MVSRPQGGPRSRRALRGRRCRRRTRRWSATHGAGWTAEISKPAFKDAAPDVEFDQYMDIGYGPRHLHARRVQASHSVVHRHVAVGSLGSRRADRRRGTRRPGVHGTASRDGTGSRSRPMEPWYGHSARRGSSAFAFTRTAPKPSKPPGRRSSRSRPSPSSSRRELAADT